MKAWHSKQFGGWIMKRKNDFNETQRRSIICVGLMLVDMVVIILLLVFLEFPQSLRVVIFVNLVFTLLICFFISGVVVL